MPNITVSLSQSTYLELIKEDRNKSALVEAALKPLLFPHPSYKDFTNGVWRKENNFPPLNLKRGASSFTKLYNEYLKSFLQDRSAKIEALILKEEQERIHRSDIRKKLEAEVRSEYEKKFAKLEQDERKKIKESMMAKWKALNNL